MLALASVNWTVRSPHTPSHPFTYILTARLAKGGPGRSRSVLLAHHIPACWHLERYHAHEGSDQGLTLPPTLQGGRRPGNPTTATLSPATQTGRGGSRSGSAGLGPGPAGGRGSAGACRPSGGTSASASAQEGCCLPSPPPPQHTPPDAMPLVAACPPSPSPATVDMIGHSERHVHCKQTPPFKSDSYFL